MSNLSTINTKLSAEGLKHKLVRKSLRLQEKFEQKGQVDNLPTGSQPDPTETLDVGPPTSITHRGKASFVKKSGVVKNFVVEGRESLIFFYDKKKL